MSLKSQIQDAILDFKQNPNKHQNTDQKPLKTTLKIRESSIKKQPLKEQSRKNIQNLIIEAQNVPQDQKKFQASYITQDLPPDSPTKFIKHNNNSVHDRLYKQNSIKKAQKENTSTEYRDYIQSSTKKQKIKDSSAVLLTQQLEEKLQSTLDNIDIQRLGKINFHQLGQMLTILNVFRVNFYDQNNYNPLDFATQQENFISQSQQNIEVSQYKLQDSQIQTQRIQSDIPTQPTTRRENINLCKTDRSILVGQEQQQQNSLQENRNLLRQKIDNDIHLKLWQIFTGFAPQQTEYIENSLVYEVFWALYHPLQYNPQELADIIWKYLKQTYSYLNSENFEEQQFQEYQNTIKNFTTLFKKITFDNLAYQDIGQVKQKNCEKIIKENEEKFSFTPSINEKSCILDRKSSKKLIERSTSQKFMSQSQQQFESMVESPVKPQQFNLQQQQQTELSNNNILSSQKYQQDGEEQQFFNPVYISQQQKQQQLGLQEPNSPTRIIYQQSPEKESYNNNITTNTTSNTKVFFENMPEKDFVIQNNNNKKQEKMVKSNYYQQQQQQNSLQDSMYQQQSVKSPIKHSNNKAMMGSVVAQNMANSMLQTQSFSQMKTVQDSMVFNNNFNQSSVMQHNQILTKSQNVLYPKEHITNILNSQNNLNKASLRASQLNGRNPSTSPLQRLDIMQERQQIKKQNMDYLVSQIDKKHNQECPFQPDTTLNKTINEIALQSFYNGEKDVVKRLYRFKSREQKQQQEKFSQIVKVQQELRDCTFRPQTNHSSAQKKNIGITSSRKSTQNMKSSQLVTGFENCVDRIRSSRKKSIEKKLIKEHIPKGEKYEYYKNMEFNPPSFLNRKKSNSIQPTSSNKNSARKNVPSSLKQSQKGQSGQKFKQQQQQQLLQSQQQTDIEQQSVYQKQQQDQQIQQEDRIKQVNQQQQQQQANKKPFYYIDINLENNTVGTLSLYEDDVPGEVAQQFCQLHNLDQESFQEIKNLVSNELLKHKKKLIQKQQQQQQSQQQFQYSQNVQQQQQSFITPQKPVFDKEKIGDNSSRSAQLPTQSTNMTQNQLLSYNTKYPETLAEKIATESILGESLE